MLPPRPYRRLFSPRVLPLMLVGSVVGCSPADDLTPPGELAPASTAGSKHPVTIRTPDGPPAIPTGTFDEHGNPVTVGCATCHTTLPVSADAKLGTPLVLFHQAVTGSHGNLACAACHNPADGYASLRLANGEAVEYPDVMALCAQCHGTQYRDYLHGSHGGMAGYWDLTKGVRVRNNCVDCHAPHSPKYPAVVPAPGPNNRLPVGGGHD